MSSEGLPRLLASGRRRGLLARLLANGVAQAVALVATALLVQRAFDRLIGAPRELSGSTLAAYGGGLALAAVAAGALRLGERTDAERLGQHYVHTLRMTLYGRLVTLSPRTVQRRSQGGVVLRFVGDLTAIRQWVSLGLSRVLVSGTFLVTALAVLAVVSPALAAAVGGIVALGVAVAFALGRPMRATARAARRRRTRLAANLTEQVGAVAVVQSFGQVERETGRVARQSRRLGRSMVTRARVIGRLRGATEAVAGLATGAALLVGATEVAAGRASPGTVVAAMMIVGLLIAPLRDLGRVPEYWHASRVSLEKARSFANTRPRMEERPNALPLAPGPGRLDIRAVTVEGALDRVTASVEPGQVVAVVGPNGAGKSSLLGLLGRLADPDEGEVLLDGQDLREHTLPSVRASVGTAGPDLPLLRGSVARNLRYRQPDAPPEELARVWRLCELDDVLADLAQGGDTRSGEGGRALSAGQRQRVTLARALVGDPPVLLLDEADANLDALAAGVLDRVVETLHGRRTVVMVTHRTAAVQAADVVWHLAAGRLVEVGSPEELFSLDGPTARMFGPARGAEVVPLLSPRSRLAREGG